ncbi:MAG: VOC family protein [Pseudomonadota bacterium]
MLHLGMTTILVADYDEARAFFTRAFGFVTLEDTPLSAQKRWLVMGPRGGNGARLLLAKATSADQSARIGKQGGDSHGRVMFFLETDDFDRDYARMHQASVRFRELPRREDYGRVVVFEDLYGNRWDLIEPTPNS